MNLAFTFDAAETILSGERLYDVDFSDVVLNFADLSNAYLYNADLSEHASRVTVWADVGTPRLDRSIRHLAPTRERGTQHRGPR
jgi:hypothetical protein